MNHHQESPALKIAYFKSSSGLQSKSLETLLEEHFIGMYWYCQFHGIVMTNVCQYHHGYMMVLNRSVQKV